MGLQFTVLVRTGGGVKICCQDICRSGAMGLCKSNHTGVQYLRTFEEVTVHSRLGASKACPQFKEHVFNVISRVSQVYLALLLRMENFAF